MTADRYLVTLLDAKGAPVTSCDFTDVEQAKTYRDNAKVLAAKIGGRVVEEPELGET